jgi:hypothetical protein
MTGRRFLSEAGLGAAICMESFLREKGFEDVPRKRTDEEHRDVLEEAYQRWGGGVRSEARRSSLGGGAEPRHTTTHEKGSLRARFHF